MKKKIKNLLILTALLVVLIGGYFILDMLPENTEEEELDDITETVKIAEFDSGDIASYCYSNEEYEIGFIVTEDGYIHYREENFPVKVASVEAQLSAIGELKAEQVVSGTDKTEYGLDVPKATVAVTLKDGTERTFFIGDSALFVDADYVLDVENDKIYLVDSNFYSEFTVDRSSMIQQEEKISITGGQIVDVTVDTAGIQTIQISYEETKENPWQLTTAEGTFDGDSEAVLDAFDIFSSYSQGSTIEYNCLDFEQYGLVEPVTKVVVRYTAEETENIETLLFEFGNVNEDSLESYVRINGSSYVYGMSEYNAEALSTFDVEELKYVSEEAEEN